MTIPILRVDASLPATAAEQIVAQIAASIESGALRPEAPLPTIRRLSADLGLAPGTVARAYAELERRGWVVTQGRRGTSVASTLPAAADDDIASAARAMVLAVRGARLSVADAHRALDVAFARWGEPGARSA